MSPSAQGSLNVSRRPPLEGGVAGLAVGPGGLGVPVLLVHGSMDRASSLGRVQTHLRDDTVITYDRRGYADSARRPPSSSYEDHVDDLIEVADNRPVVALGHSLGGTILLGAAARRPDLILGAVIWEAPMPWLPWWPATTPGRLAVADGRSPGDVAESFVVALIGERIWRRLPTATREARRGEGPALIAEMRAVGTHPGWEPADIAIPVIVGRGAESVEHQRRGAKELAAAIPGAELVDVESCGHGVHLSHPAVLAELIGRVAARAGVGNRGVGGAESICDEWRRS